MNLGPPALTIALQSSYINNGKNSWYLILSRFMLEQSPCQELPEFMVLSSGGCHFASLDFKEVCVTGERRKKTQKTLILDEVCCMHILLFYILHCISIFWQCGLHCCRNNWFLFCLTTWIIFSLVKKYWKSSNYPMLFSKDFQIIHSWNTGSMIWKATPKSNMLSF